jgi:hypothetical protein
VEIVPVEVDPTRSHQHEFHAGRLRVGLGFGNKPVRGRLRLLVYRDEHSEPRVVEDEFTLYDARAGNPRRSEWHLYYRSAALAELSQPGDLLVLYRPFDGPDLHGVVVAADTARADILLDSLMLRDDAVLREFRLIAEPEPTPAAHQLGVTLSADETRVPAREYPVAEHALVRRAVAEARTPATRTMAEAAAGLIPADAARSDPDRYLAEALDAETALYFAIENALNRARLDELQQVDAPVSSYLEWAMGIHQARRSRRGQSLQLHFEALLKVAHIPYSAQCRTEPGEVPDFVVPGCAEYHDADFRADRLRMVACKSTSKERWRQILNEAERVPEKYLLTLDPGLSLSTLEQMLAASVRPFLPVSVTAAAYSGVAERAMLGSVADLLRLLEDAISDA